MMPERLSEALHKAASGVADLEDLKLPQDKMSYFSGLLVDEIRRIADEVQKRFKD